ncbi:threonylcarbamoyl-AMP synthase [Jiella sp. MQZ9-1]|uniref:Threonylcarbamoyl-AMP synthase n=1 Tax=Jiella flava TaxID=2816857 RepID=A0A939JXK1_9HYPH|nr:L-threonylcarbamoyladenylate synthase [Jiella flava]MBO0664162.1 threonylcarbamoyl-AMP synthase [Jiella flava]MCD2472734.1 threonylcarbamoyl-AMP synthase [Jiella flava]
MRTEILPLSDPTAEPRAEALLKAGALVALPTETVYGLAGDSGSGDAVAGIFAAKGRPRFNPLICHVASLSMGRSIATFDDVALQLARHFWPGPLTLVLPLAADAAIHPLATAGLPTVAVRMPRGVVARLAGRLGRPIVAPSANLSGRVTGTSADAVARGLGGRIPLILDDGPSKVGVESTIIRPDGDRLLLLRAGGVGREEIAAASGLPIETPASGAPIAAPGGLASHYAPAGQIRLDAQTIESGEFVIAFGSDTPRGLERAAAVVNLSPSGDLTEAAANLFAALAAFDRPQIQRIAVTPIPRTGLGEAINDRLTRAAAPR